MRMKPVTAFANRLFQSWKRYDTSRMVIGLALAAVLLEIFVFNIQYWQSRTYSQVTGVSFSVGTGLKKQSGDSYLVADPEEATITIKGINTQVHNIEVPVEKVTIYQQIDGSRFPVPRESQIASRDDAALRIHMTVDDEPHPNGLELPEVAISPAVASSRWIRLHLSGTTQKITIHIQNSAGTSIVLSDMPRINVQRPLQINPLRILIYLMIIAFAAIFPIIRNGWKTKNHSGVFTRGVWIGSASVAALLAVGTLVLTLPWLYMRTSVWQADFEYQSVARSLLAGHSWIDYPVADTLRDLSNPYNSDIRAQVVSGDSYLFDYAFYDGKYYSYFGVLPAVIFFLPYLALTGNDLAPWKAMLVIVFILAILCVGVVYLLFKKWGARAPLPVQTVLAVSFSCVVQPALYLSYMSTTYSVPIGFGLILALSAICLWLKGSMLPSTKRRQRLMYYVAGGLLSGLIVGCRPQICAVVIILPLCIIASEYWSNGISIVAKCKDFFSTSILSALAAVVTASPFLFWNVIRFDSPFDFGATYQLTMVDMNQQKADISKIPYAIVEGILSPVSVLDRFPYLSAISGESRSAGGYQGFFYCEPVFGSLLFWFPVALILTLFVFSTIRKSISWPAKINVAGCLLMSLLPLTVDVMMASYTMRYLCDSGYLFGMSAVIFIAVLFNTWDKIETNRKALYIFSIVTGLLTLILAIWSIFLSGKFNMLIDANPTLYVLAQQTLTF